jgi:5-methylcytosine-specific restriction endonuclease McrA
MAQAKAPYRWVIFGPALPAALIGWRELGEPFHRGDGMPVSAAWSAALIGQFPRPGLLVFVFLGLLLVPVLMLALITAPGALLHAMIPKDWRRRWRKHDWRTGFRRPMKHPGPPGALMQRMVRAADRNRCVHCDATAEQVKEAARLMALTAGRRQLYQSSLQLDHYFPWILGGLMTFWNFYLLCPACNIAKSCYWRYRESGNEVYSRHADPRNITTARAILASEQRLRRNPVRNLLRCWRAAWAL